MLDYAGEAQRGVESGGEEGTGHPDRQAPLHGSHEALAPMRSRDDAVPGLRISPGRVTRVLLAFITVLTLVNLVTVAVVEVIDEPALMYESDVIQLFSIDFEQSLSTWYQGTMIALCGVLLLSLGTAHRQRGRTRFSAYWFLLAVIFFGISLDEMLAVHEQSMVPIRSALGISGGVLYFAWVIPASALLVLLAVGLVPFLRSLPTETRRQFLAAGTIYVSGALGFELIAGAYVSSGSGGDTLLYKLLATVEELLEMLGIIAFLRAILIYMARGDGTIRISLPTK
jgi:hypothetical protein